MADTATQIDPIKTHVRVPSIAVQDGTFPRKGIANDVTGEVTWHNSYIRAGEAFDFRGVIDQYPPWARPDPEHCEPALLALVEAHRQVKLELAERRARGGLNDDQALAALSVDRAAVAVQQTKLTEDAAALAEREAALAAREAALAKQEAALAGKGGPAPKGSTEPDQTAKAPTAGGKPARASDATV